MYNNNLDLNKLINALDDPIKKFRSLIACQKKEALDAQDPNNKLTLLMYALQDNKSNHARFLIQQGVDVHLKDKYNKTALMYAVKHTIQHISALPRNKQESHQKIYESISYNSCNVKLLIDRGADVNTQDKDGKSALMYAARHDNVCNIDLLLKAGADICSKDKANKGALAYAEALGNSDSANFLKKYKKC